MVTQMHNLYAEKMMMRSLVNHIQASNKEAFMKERNAYIKDTGAYSGMIQLKMKKPIRGLRCSWSCIRFKR